MRLHRPNFSVSLLLSGSLLALGACGDDGSPGTGDDSGTTMGNGTTGPSATTSNESLDTTAGPPGTTTGEPTTGLDTTAGQEESTTGDDTTTTSDTDTDTESSTGDPPVDCGAGMSFSTLTSVDNDMITNLDVSSALVNCNMDITITVTGGTICAVDDGAGGYYYTVETLTLADVPEMPCGGAQVGLTNVSIEDIGDGMEVVVDQAGGTVTGNQSITVNGDVEGNFLGMDITAPLMMFDGNLPEGDVEFGADDTTVTYADDLTVIATAMPELMGFAITVTLTGLDGSITLAQ